MRGRLVRCCLGQSAVAKAKLECNNPLTVSGITTTLDSSGVTFWPDEKKVQKWTKQIESFLDKKRITDGESQKLTGALQWGVQKIFNRLGRAMLRPLIRNNNWAHTEMALQWWLEVLRLGIKKRRLWMEKNDKPLHLFCDARSTPPRVAAVLFGCKQVLYCDMMPSDAK